MWVSSTGCEWLPLVVIVFTSKCSTFNSRLAFFLALNVSQVTDCFDPPKCSFPKEEVNRSRRSNIVACQITFKQDLQWLYFLQQRRKESLNLISDLTQTRWVCLLVLVTYASLRISAITLFPPSCVTSSLIFRAASLLLLGPLSYSC